MSTNSVAEKTILITGASSGVGRAVALQLAAAGARVVLLARRGHELGEVASAIASKGGWARTYVADLADGSSASSVGKKICEDHGPVDVLINNAAISIRRPVLESVDRANDFRRTMATNYHGAVELTLAVLPQMVARQQGHIVNVSTIGVQTGAPNFAAYVASKAALDEFARTLSLELGNKGITVTTVNLGLVRTAMIQPTEIYDSFPAATAEQAADIIARALVTRRRRVAPKLATLLELITTLAPGAVDAVFHRFHHRFHELMKRRSPRRERRKPMESTSAETRGPIRPVEAGKAKVDKKKVRT